MRIETYEFIQNLEILRQELINSPYKLRSVFPGHSEFITENFDIRIFILPNENSFQLFISHPHNGYYDEYLSLMIDLDKDVDYKNTIHHSALILLEKLPMCLKFINKYVNCKGTDEN